MLLLSQQPAELCNAIQYAKVLSLVKKGKVFGQAFFKRLVRSRVKPSSPSADGEIPIRQALCKR